MNRTSGARTAILARVRAAQRTAVLPQLHESHGSAPSAESPIAEVAARFEQELSALGVEVHHAASAERARDVVSRVVQGKTVLSWDASALPHDLFHVLQAPSTGSSTRDEQAAAEIGVTACDAAIAETGSLLLLSGPGRARTVSLLPRTHLAVVRRGVIVPTLADAFERLHDHMQTAASCTVITGPSRTADIELTLTLGIHGPGHLIVVIAP